MVLVVELAELFVVVDVELYAADVAVDVEFVYQLVIELAVNLKKLFFKKKSK